MPRFTFTAAELDSWRLSSAVDQLTACRDALDRPVQMVVVAGRVSAGEDLSAGIELAEARGVEVVMLDIHR